MDHHGKADGQFCSALRPDVDFTSCRDLIDGRYLDSLTILALVAELEEAFDITIPTA